MSRRWSALLPAVLLLSACGQGATAPPSESPDQELAQASIAPVKVGAVDNALSDLRGRLPSGVHLADDAAARSLKSVCAGHLAGLTDEEIRRSLSDELSSLLGKKPSDGTADAIAASARAQMCPE